MGRRSTTGGVTPAGERITVRFTFRGADLQPTLPLKPTQGNLKAAARIRQNILDEIKAGTFDLHKYFPDYRFAAKHQAPVESANRTLQEWADEWYAVAGREREHSTLEVYKDHMARYWLSAWGARPVREITNHMIRKRLSALAAERDDGVALSRKTQNNIMIPLRAVLGLVAANVPGFTSPATGIVNLKLEDPEPDPFAADEVEALLADLRQRDPPAADYFEFACFAGLRPSEQIALLWSDVDLRTMVVKVQRARVMREDKARTKTHRRRDVELNDRAAAALTRQRARTQLAGGHVFVDPEGAPWADGDGLRLVWEAAQRRCGIRYRPPKECRDTSVCLALAAGADPYWTAEQHGHSIQTMQKSYAAWMPKADRGRNRMAVNAALKAQGVV